MTGLVSCLFLLAQTFISLDQALEIALSENVAVKIADKEIERSEYAKKGTYAALFPQIDASGGFQRTIEKQVMYMDFDMSSIMPGGGAPGGEGESSENKNNGMEVGRWNSFSAGVSASMPLVNAQLWESLKISGQDVELAVDWLNARGIETEPVRTDPYNGGRFTFFHDPDGLPLEVHE